jgi:formylglycine-generating enzyme required for sulfatase activity
LYSLSAALLPLLEPETKELDRLVRIGEMADHLAQGRLTLRDVVEQVVKNQRGTNRLLLGVDQWEELYTYTKEDKARKLGARTAVVGAPGDKARKISTRFIEEVLSATETAPLTVVLTLRADFYGEALTHRDLSDRLQAAQVNLGPMSREELERAVREPAKKAGLEFDVGLVDRLLDDVGGEPGNLPLLEFALKQLWSARRGNRLQHAVYKSMGGVRGAIARRAEDVYAKLDMGQKGIAERVFTKLVRPGYETGDTRRRRALGDFDEAGQALIRTLAGPDARLLTTGRVEGTDQETVEVAHEALIREWDRMDEWVGKVRKQLKDEAVLEDLAHAWDEHGGGLASARQLRDFRRVEAPSELAQKYVKASRSRAQQRFVGVAAFVALSLAGVWAGTQYFASSQLGWRVAAIDGREVPDPRVSLTRDAESTDYDWLWWRRWFLKPGTEYWLKVHADGYSEWSDSIRIPVGGESRVYKVTLLAEEPDRNMVLIQPGCFTMGSDKYADNERPPRQVCLSRPFRIGRSEVTVAEYERFAGANGLEPPDDMGWGRDSRPAINVSWEDAFAYARWLSEETGKRYRLPTEAEWEYAARAGAQTDYWWGDAIRENAKVWANCDGCGSWWDNDSTAPVGAFEANGLGLHDTAGNVWEWVADCWHESYQGAPTDGSAWEEGGGGDCGQRVVRGCSWNCRPVGLRSATRSGFHADARPGYIGFRLARDL